MGVMNKNNLHPNRFQVANSHDDLYPQIVSKPITNNYSQVGLGEIGLKLVWQDLVAFTYDGKID